MKHFVGNMFVFLPGIIFNFVNLGVCWKAVPANQAMYGLRSSQWEWVEHNKTIQLIDTQRPRNVLSFSYKFGWCRPDAISPHYLLKSTRLYLPKQSDQRANYIYLVEDKHTIRYISQCVVMKAYVPRKFMFFKSRLPLYYCQGTILVLMMRSVQRFALHEFYLQHKMGFPVDFVFEFYQTPLPYK